MAPSVFALTTLCLLSLVVEAIGQSSPPDQTASTLQTRSWLGAHQSERLIIVTDPRDKPVRRHDRIPAIWMTRSKGELERFDGVAQPGEFYVFQVSVVNNGIQPVTIHSIAFRGLPKEIEATCLNQAVSMDPGKRITIQPSQIQPLWIGIQAVQPGIVSGNVEIAVALGESGSFEQLSAPFRVKVEGTPVPNHGVDEGWRLARLKWLLPSELGIDSKPTKSFKAIGRIGNLITLTSTTLALEPNGLPAQIKSRSESPLELLAAPAHLAVVSEKGELSWSTPHLAFAPHRDDRVSWKATQDSKEATLLVEGSAEFDGFVRYRVVLEAKEALNLSDVRLDVPYRKESARFQLGLGFHGGYAPPKTDWKWNVAYQQDCVWLGDVSVGAQWRFKGSNYERPLVNIYYGFRPLNLPDSWGNSGLGGIQVEPSGVKSTLLKAYSGNRRMEPGERLEFNFDLQITPSRPIDTEKQWATRFYHPNELSEAAKIDQAVDTAKQDGANVINIHHRKPVNPFINYPFNDFSVPDLKSFVDSAHKRDIRVKLYYTTRELTWQLPEIWALKSFGDAIIQSGPGPNARTVINPNGAHPLLTESLVDNFIPAWTASLDGKYAGKLDLAVITRPDSAWSNYYLNGLDWLVKNIHIDGTYIDDTALDRTSLQRARRILEGGRPDPLIDLHSWNHEDPLAARGSSTSIYMELFPYIDRIWLGEGFDYTNTTPDYWLVAMSGIPYGVMSEMLQNGGNVWRGMLFGETCRLGWSGDPRSMWQFWDRFGMSGTQMIGWWDRGCPVKTDSIDVPATVYKKSGKCLVAIANWTGKAKEIRLLIDWKKLGLDPSKAKISAQSIEGFQSETKWNVGEPIEVPGGKGWLLVIQ